MALALRKLGFKANTAETKQLVRAMDANRDGTVDVREWCSAVTPTVRLALEESLDAHAHAGVVAFKRYRAEEREARSAKTDAARAARVIQNKYRQRSAGMVLAGKRWEKSAAGLEQTRAAVLLQNTMRSNKARKQMRGRYKEVVEKYVAKTLAEPDFQAMVVKALESIVHNLVEEDMESDFNLAGVPGAYGYGRGFVEE